MTVLTPYANLPDKVFVKLMGFDDRGKVRLTMKHIDQETGRIKQKAKIMMPTNCRQKEIDHLDHLQGKERNNFLIYLDYFYFSVEESL